MFIHHPRRARSGPKTTTTATKQKKRDRAAMDPRPLRCARKRKGRCSIQHPQPTAGWVVQFEENSQSIRINLPTFEGLALVFQKILQSSKDLSCCFKRFTIFQRSEVAASKDLQSSKVRTVGRNSTLSAYFQSNKTTTNGCFIVGIRKNSVIFTHTLLPLPIGYRLRCCQIRLLQVLKNGSLKPTTFVKSFTDDLVPRKIID
ncbi:hypothetical protein CEXT_463731 [Caerostris extrusa]|uniref:Uncharacterized protein n=1 Tax=Caerostris extrusa TaxID=172846 RepID=A0AAV4UEX6_CAEEX|nr:hypothetical protein CEXT_463731 [Caerostris extrusa]